MTDSGSRARRADGRSRAPRCGVVVSRGDRVRGGNESPASSRAGDADGSEALHEAVGGALQTKAANGDAGATPEPHACRTLRRWQIAGETPDGYRDDVARSLVDRGYPAVE